MIENLMLTINSYFHFYGKFLLKEWHQITPMKYGSLLIGIAVFGWLLMKGSDKK